jgi:hypothetical protein
VVEVNRAVAVAMAHGPAAGLAVVEELGAEALRRYHLLPAVRGDLLHKLRRYEEARVAFERAAELTQNVPERQSLLARAAPCGDPSWYFGSAAAGQVREAVVICSDVPRRSAGEGWCSRNTPICNAPPAGLDLQPIVDRLPPKPPHRRPGSRRGEGFPQELVHHDGLAGHW